MKVTEFHAEMAGIFERCDRACLAGAKRQVVNVGELERLGGSHPTLTDPPILPYLVLWDFSRHFILILVLLNVATFLGVMLIASLVEAVLT